jgi:hypothetical protein
MDTRMSRPWRLAVIVLVTAALIILIAVARGRKHHRGDETGATGVTHIAFRQGGADG